MVKKKATRPLWPGCNKRLVNNYTLHTNTVGRNNTQDKYSLVVNGNSIAATAELLTLNYGTGEVNHLYHVAIGIHSQGKGSLTGVGRNAKRQHFYIANGGSNSGIHRRHFPINNGYHGRSSKDIYILVFVVFQDGSKSNQILAVSGFKHPAFNVKVQVSTCITKIIKVCRLRIPYHPAIGCSPIRKNNRQRINAAIFCNGYLKVEDNHFNHIRT